MKTKLTCLSILLLFAAGCNETDTPLEQYGRISFRITGLTPQSAESPEYSPLVLLLSIETDGGQLIYDHETFTLLTAGEEATTEQAFILPAGAYKITRFVLISNDKALYAIPTEGSPKAALSDNAVPIRFDITSGTEKQLMPRVLAVQEGDRAVDFGYDNFGVGEEPGAASWMNIRVKFEATVGRIFYENTDAEFFVTAYDESNKEMWRAKLPYTGPRANDLRIRTGFDHYVFEVQKWSMKSRQEFKGSYLWDRRVQEGTVPTTFLFAASAPVKKLAYIIHYTRSNGTLTTDSKTSYQYNNDGTLGSTLHYEFSGPANSFVLMGNSSFTYQSGRVMKIESFATGSTTPGESVAYTYDNERRPVHMEHRSQSSGLTTEIALQYASGGRVVNATYKSSNGQQFEYTFVNEMGVIKSDRTTRGGALCSEGAYNYDKGINPLSHLGYTDYLLRNYSINNRLIDEVTYTACSFPSLIPEFTDYSYDGDGYPTSATKHYKDSDVESITRYFYQ